MDKHDHDAHSSPADGPPQKKGLWGMWCGIPIYKRILAGLVFGIVVGLVFGVEAKVLALPGKLMLRLLSALAPPLVLAAIVHALITSEIGGRLAGRMARLLVLNTAVAIFIGLLVANVMQPGKHASPPTPHAETTKAAGPDIMAQFLDNVPKSLLGPLTDGGSVLSVIFLALAFGIALRSEKRRALATVEDAVTVFRDVLVKILHWILQVIPFGVFGVIASVVGEKGLSDFKALGMFVVAVLTALLLQTAWYLTRIRFGCWASPMAVLRAVRDALVMAFSTGSSTATMPVTYECLTAKLGLRERSSSMGALVGANFNNDGTALYEAMAALFVSQMLGMNLSLEQQTMVALTSVIASVGAAGIPEAGLVTMTLVFNAVGLPVQYIVFLITVDWFLDRCRTAINVLGDVNVSCLLDGKVKEVAIPEAT